MEEKYGAFNLQVGEGVNFMVFAGMLFIVKHIVMVSVIIIILKRW